MPRATRPQALLESEASVLYFIYFIETKEAEAARRVVQIVSERILRGFGLDPVRDVQVLCPMNRGALGARTLNLDLQAALNPPGVAAAVERFGWTYRAGDKVMQTENDYDKEVFNGDVGFIEAVDAGQGELTARFDDRPVTYELGELDRLAPAYATTVHRAQGSEYPAVVVPLTMRHYPMLRRNLIYTAVTRARRLLVLVGERRALVVAVKGRRVDEVGRMLAHSVCHRPGQAWSGISMLWSCSSTGSVGSVPQTSEALATIIWSQEQSRPATAYSYLRRL